MIFGFSSKTSPTTSAAVVLPFYIYAAAAFGVATILLFFVTNSLTQHYTSPPLLGITHTLTLGWGTMVIFGASYQLVPVLIERKLQSTKLAMISFGLMAVGIPLLIYGFFRADMGMITRWGGHLVVSGVILYGINMFVSAFLSKKVNIHVVFLLASLGWLLYTVFLGICLVYNMSVPIFEENSWHYLPLHAHIGIVGWFLQLVIGVASRLIPMFLISKYNNPRLLWFSFAFLNSGLIAFVLSFYFFSTALVYLLAVLLVFASMALFFYYNYMSFKSRIRKAVERPMLLSLFSLVASLVPILLITLLLTVRTHTEAQARWTLLYGFWIFLGWLTSIILGMTFKTLPFIVWNQVYRQVGYGKAPNPKDLFSEKIFNAMTAAYGVALLILGFGILLKINILLKIGAAFFVLTAFLYNLNVLKITTHKPKKQ